MKYTVRKIDAAIDQLNWAIKLFLDHQAYIPAITLAGAAEEVVGEAVLSNATFRKLKKILSEETGITEEAVSQEYLNKTKNWLKHWNKMKDVESLEIELETEAIQYIVRAINNLLIYDELLASETPRFLNWLNKNRSDLVNG